MNCKSATRNRRGIRRAGARSGFTLAEVLAALVFMAIVIPVALEGLSIASRAGEVAARKTEAALVAERILNENIVTTNWDRGIQNGTVWQGLREFRWSLRNEPWNQDPNLTTLRLLSVEVAYTARGQEFNLRLSTLVDSQNPYNVTNLIQ
jgi:type II secretory pathway pseudopilin PulG